MPRCAPRAPLPERARSRELDADMTRMTPMAAAARCSFVFARCRDQDRKGGLRSGAATRPTPSKQPDAATPDEKSQPARMRNDPKFSFSVRITPAFQPRRLMIASAADGCKRRLDLITDLHSQPTRDVLVVAAFTEPVEAIDIRTNVFIEGLPTETAVRMVRNHLERAVRIVQDAGTRVELGS
jgi:hypothetical protein